MAQLWSSGKLVEEGGATSMSKLAKAENYLENLRNHLHKPFQKFWKQYGKGWRGWRPVLKIRYHGYHGRGTKGIWGDQRDIYCFFGENIWEIFLVLPESLFCPLKFSLWSSQNHCSVPSNSVFVPPKSLFNNMSPQIPLFLHQIPFIVHQKYCFVPS